jgi:HEAT repeat protein
MKAPNTDVSRFLPQLFEAERSVRRSHQELVNLPHVHLVEGLATAVGEALALDEEEESALRLVRIAALLGEIEGPRSVDLLIDILGSEEPEARHASGEALEEIAFERFKEVALGAERALDRLPAGNPALHELPFLLAGIGEPGVRKILGRFLASVDPEAVSAAIEAIVEMGDSGAIPSLERLKSDSRQVTLEDERGEEGKVTLGELAEEAIELLGDLEEPANVRGIASHAAGASDPSATRARAKGRSPLG